MDESLNSSAVNTLTVPMNQNNPVAAPKSKPKWLSKLHMLFYVIAEHEMNIEQVRRELCENEDFSPKCLFKYIQ